MKKSFLSNTEGAMSIEWIIGMSALAVLGMAVVMSIDNGTDNVVAGIDDTFQSLQMDLMNSQPSPTVVEQVGSSGYNISQGGSVYAQVNCQHYSMSNGTVWKSCTQRLLETGETTSYWLDDTGTQTDAPDIG